MAEGAVARFELLSPPSGSRGLPHLNEGELPTASPPTCKKNLFLCLPDRPVLLSEKLVAHMPKRLRTVANSFSPCPPPDGEAIWWRTSQPGEGMIADALGFTPIALTKKDKYLTEGHILFGSILLKAFVLSQIEQCSESIGRFRTVSDRRESYASRFIFRYLVRRILTLRTRVIYYLQRLNFKFYDEFVAGQGNLGQEIHVVDEGGVHRVGRHATVLDWSVSSIFTNT